MKKIVGIIFLLIVLSACSFNEIPESLIPKKANKFAIDYIQKLSEGDTIYCYSKLEKQYQNDDAMQFFSSLYQSLKDMKLLSSRIIDSRYTTFHSENNETIYNLKYEYVYSDNRWAYYTFVIIEKQKRLEIQTFHVLPTFSSMSEIHNFNFKDKSFWHYLWFCFAILVPIFIFFTIFFVFKTKMKLKWLWIIFILLGFGSFSLNWTTGQGTFQLLEFKLLGAGIIKSGLIAPWILSFNIPLGAILFWSMRKKVLTINNTNTPIMSVYPREEIVVVQKVVKMDRQKRLEFCKICLNRELDFKRGMICKFTNDLADFEETCEKFEEDIQEKDRLLERDIKVSRSRFLS